MFRLGNACKVLFQIRLMSILCPHACWLWSKQENCDSSVLSFTLLGFVTLIKRIVLIVYPNHLLGHGDRKPVRWALNPLGPGADATMWCLNCTVNLFSKLTLCSWSTQLKQAVFPVPGAPEMYRLDGFPGTTCFSRKETITPRSGSLESSRSGTAVWRACFTQWYGVSEK